jgi:hypothetical protein
MEVSMLRKFRSRITYANVVSTLALGLAIGGGTAYAAATIGTSNIRYHAVTGSKVATNAVTASKVKNSALSGADLRDNSVTAADIRNGTLLAADFAANQLPKGDKGDKGDPATAIFGIVTADGGITNSRNVLSMSGAPASGTYIATINQDVSRCAAVATLTGGNAGSVTAQPTPGNAQQITFQARGEAANETPRAFQFAVYC